MISRVLRKLSQVPGSISVKVAQKHLKRKEESQKEQKQKEHHKKKFKK